MHPNWVAERLGASSQRPRHPFPALMAGVSPGRVPVHTALKNQTPRRPTRARPTTLSESQRQLRRLHSFCAVRTIPAPVVAGMHTLSRNCTCVNSTGICTVWTSVLHTTGKATWSKNCTCELHVFGTVWTMSGTCKRISTGMSITLSRSEELHCGISTVFSTPAAEKHAQPTVEHFVNGLQLDNLYGQLNRQTKGAVSARQK